MVEKTLWEVKNKDRKEAQKQKTRTYKKVLTFVAQFQPSRPKFEKHNYVQIHREIFKEPPLWYGKGKPLKDVLVKAKQRLWPQGTRTLYQQQQQTKTLFFMTRIFTILQKYILIKLKKLDNSNSAAGTRR